MCMSYGHRDSCCFILFLYVSLIFQKQYQNKFQKKFVDLLLVGEQMIVLFATYGLCSHKWKT